LYQVLKSKMATKNPPVRKSVFGQAPGGKTHVLRIEITHLNGRIFKEVLSTADIKAIWISSLKLKPEYLLRQANFRGPNDSFRINYRLTEPAHLSQLVTNPDILFEKISNVTNAVEVYTGRVLDIESIEEAKIGETVTVIIKRTNAELSEEQVAQWLSRFGKIVIPPR